MSRWMSGWMGGWMGGWVLMGGWMGDGYIDTGELLVYTVKNNSHEGNFFVV